jgi:5-methyltetrahydrofolate--homocysteine methyltransferase
LQDEKYGEAARELFGHGKELLERIAKEKLLTARAAYGIWPAHSEGDDVVLFQDEEKKSELVRFPMLREQTSRGEKDPCLCLADFVADKELGVTDYVGAFAVTGGLGAEALAREFESDSDDYSAIMVKALADRLAEAMAERTHAKVRKLWGYETTEPDTEQLIAEQFRGIRPAFGYPACPDHRPKQALFEILAAQELGMALTESFAMTPAASVSGLYFAHEKARYFNVGRLGRDQLEDYSERMGSTLKETETWLQSNLGYKPQ